jgi:hypothetical protein
LEMGVLLFLPKMAWMSFYASCSSWEDRCALLCPFFFSFFCWDGCLTSFFFPGLPWNYDPAFHVAWDNHGYALVLPVSGWDGVSGTICFG